MVPGNEGAEVGEVSGVSEVTGVTLDNDGNAFVVVIGDSSCAEGPSLIEADLESKPFTTFTTTFTTLPPQPTAEPSFTIEKRQQIAGTASGFTTSPLTGSIGQMVDYEIVVKNTGNVPETFSEFSDPHCDPGDLEFDPIDPGSAARPARSLGHHRQFRLDRLHRHEHRRRSQGGLPGQPAPGEELLRR